MYAPSILMFLLGAAVFYGGIRMMRTTRLSMKAAEESLLWPKVPARITASGISIFEQGDIGYCLPEVTYTYTGGDLLYTGTAISYRDVRLLKKAANLLVAKYPVGSDVTVTYNPNDPRFGVLEPGIEGVMNSYYGGRAMVFLGVSLAALSIAIPVFGLK